jgi:polyhydroxyalkanoate synthesis regulator phasin
MAANHLNRNGPPPASVTADATRRRHRGNFLVTLCTLVILSLTVAVSPARAERDPLLEVLIRKGVLTPEEAEQVQREAKDLGKARDKKTEKQVEQKVEQKVTASQQQVTTEVKDQLAAVEKKVENFPVLPAASELWPAHLPDCSREDAGSDQAAAFR